MANGGPSTVQSGGPKPAPVAQQQQQSEAVQSKRDLASWWKQFKRSDKKAQEQIAVAPPQGIFGVPLQTSIRYANVAISLFNDEGQSYIYGYVPIVVAKCGVFLKEKATDVEGIFRLAGSEKRIKELKVAFDSPDRFGKGLDWTGYTVHDAANILRRYFNQLPEPIIPLEFYERFRDPLKNHQAQAVGQMDAQSPTVGDFDHEAAIKIYQNLITELPPLNRQLLLYILDLLAVFASKSDLNKMTTPNLAAIFQPGLLSHPQHDMAPQEYRLSQDVLIFLIENQDSFLIGMAGTAADHDTVKDVQSGAHSPSRTPSTPSTPSRSKTVLGRSTSNASTGADGRWANLRRNVSVSSKQSKRSEGAPTPGTPGPPTPGGGSVHRSNTLPSRRAGSANHSPRFSREKVSDASTPSQASAAATNESPKQHSYQTTPVAATAPTFPPPAPIEVTSASSSEATTPLAGVIGSDTSSTVTRDYHTPKKDTIPLLGPPSATADTSADRTASTTPSATNTRGFLDIFKQSPTSDSEGRKPNKLQKKRIPGSALSSAQSSSHSLGQEGAEPAPVSPPQIPQVSASAESHGPEQAVATTTPQRTATDATIRRNTSPSHSVRSQPSVTDQSDADLVGDDMPPQSQESPEKHKRRHRWRFSRNQNKLETAPTPSSNTLGTMSSKEQSTSKSTIGSQPRRSFQEALPLSPTGTDPTSPPTAAPITQGVQQSNTDPSVFSDSEREKKGPMSWIRGKIQDRKEKDTDKRVKTPERKGGVDDSSRHDIRMPSVSTSGEALPVRGQSIDAPRSTSGPINPTATTNPIAKAEQGVASDNKTPTTNSATTTAETNGADVQQTGKSPVSALDGAEKDAGSTGAGGKEHEQVAAATGAKE